MNTFSHIRTYPPAGFKAVVRPNFDTLYSSAWLHPTNGSGYRIGARHDVPVAHAGHVDGRLRRARQAHNRHWSGGLCSPSSVAGHASPGTQRIDAPTPYVWIIGRTQTNGPNDYDAVHKVQDRFKITLLAEWGKPPMLTFPSTFILSTTVLGRIRNLIVILLFVLQHIGAI
jgi:hypothetical protein